MVNPSIALRVLVVDDHSMVCEGFRTLLSSLPEIEVVGSARDGHEAIRLTGELEPNIVLMDVTMPNLNGIDATRQILVDHPDVRVIALSAYGDRKFVSEMFRIGARAYILKGAPFETLVEALHAVAEGHRYIDRDITDQVLEDYSQRLTDDRHSVIDTLSARERQVLQLLAEGLTNKRIAECLFVSIKTVETHRRALMTKLDARTVAELTKIAIREGLTSLDF